MWPAEALSKGDAASSSEEKDGAKSSVCNRCG